jgi:drug/metabolite transporter (DMT)-like permease
MIKLIILVIIAELFTAAGQMLLKATANSAEPRSLRSIEGHAGLLKDVFRKPALWAAFPAMAAGLVLWIVALAQGDLSLVFSLGSLQYIVILFGAHFLLGERIDRMKFIGTFLVVFGIVLISLSR